MHALSERARAVLYAVSRDESGQDLIEYALLIAFIGFGAVASMKSLADGVKGVFNAIGSILTSAT